jgi:hypothetical protein
MAAIALVRQPKLVRAADRKANWKRAAVSPQS